MHIIHILKILLYMPIFSAAFKKICLFPLFPHLPPPTHAGSVLCPCIPFSVLTNHIHTNINPCARSVHMLHAPQQLAFLTPTSWKFTPKSRNEAQSLIVGMNPNSFGHSSADGTSFFNFYFWLLTNILMCLNAHPYF